jgi:hypothetical protein
MSPTRELWRAIYDRLSADASILALVDGCYDKEPATAWNGAKQVFITRGPTYGTDDTADCISGAEITQQIDVWSRATRRSACDDAVYAVRRSLHNAEFELTDNALVSITVELWRVNDEEVPDGPLTQHGIVHVIAMIEEPE